MSNIAIKAENISKAYQLGEFSTGTLSRDLERSWARLRGKEDPFLKIGETNDRTSKGESNIVWSLKDINFEIEQGDAIGIIGRNGAGKSTLLKILSKVTSPTSGTITGKGRIASLLEVGTGFHPELTGRENIYLNGAILGMRKAEIKRQFDAIVDFSGVERYIDTPVKRYSSGMYVRLAFAVAAHLESEILIVDEVLAVGDAEFQKKCLGKMGEVSQGEGRTVLFVSHNLSAIAELCRNSFLLKNGSLIAEGKTSQIINHYSFNGKQEVPEFKPLVVNYISKVRLENQINSIVNFDSIIKIAIDIVFTDVLKNASIGLALLDKWKRKVFTTVNIIQPANSNYKVSLPRSLFLPGSYSLDVAIFVPNGILFEYLKDICDFEIIDFSGELGLNGDDIGVIKLDADWT